MTGRESVNGHQGRLRRRLLRSRQAQPPGPGGRGPSGWDPRPAAAKDRGCLLPVCTPSGRQPPGEQRRDAVGGDGDAEAGCHVHGPVVALPARLPCGERARLGLGGGLSRHRPATDENPNRLLRQYLPKSADLRTVTGHDLTTIADRINTGPRRVLYGTASHERFDRLLHAGGVSWRIHLRASAFRSPSGAESGVEIAKELSHAPASGRCGGKTAEHHGDRWRCVMARPFKGPRGDTPVFSGRQLFGTRRMRCRAENVLHLMSVCQGMKERGASRMACRSCRVDRSG